MGDLQGGMMMVCMMVMMGTTIHAMQDDSVPITYLYDAVQQKGAACLDGSPPAYYMAKGSGEGATNWLIYIEGGGWCNKFFCASYAVQKSSLARPPTNNFTNILSSSQLTNPDFHNWNRVYVVYCDGSSFMSDTVADGNITRRGARVFNAVMDDLVTKGLKDAKNAILAGGSAGGLATILHCDSFKTFVPIAERYKCISDSGFFIRGNYPKLPGIQKRANFFVPLITYHGVKNLPASCTSKFPLAECFHPENLVNDIKTPLFLVESSHDAFQMKTGIVLGDAVSQAQWQNCTQTLENCPPNAFNIMKEFRDAMLKTIYAIGNPKTRGLFFHSCITHGHITDNPLGWNPSPVLGNKTIQQAIGDWYFDRSFVQEIDRRNVMPALCSQ